MRARTLMRWPTRALVRLGLRFGSDDLERRFAHTLRTKQMASFILLQFAFLWLIFSVAVRLPPDGLRPPIGQICSILYSAIIIYALHFARKHPELKRFWMPDALLAAMSLFPGAAQINMVSNTCRTEGSDCDPAVITQGTLALTAGAVITVHSAPARALYLIPHLIVYPCVLAGDPDAYPWDPDAFPWSDRLPTTVPVALLVVAWAMVCARERLQRQQWYRATKELEAALAKQAVLERVIAEQDAMLAIPLSPKTPVDESFKGGMFVSRTEGSFDYETVLKNCGEVEDAAFKVLKAFDPQPPLDAIEEVLRSLVDGAGAATIYVEAHKLKSQCKSLCAAEAQAAALHLEQAAKECAPKNFRGATATVLADSEDKDIRAAFESLQLAMLPLRNDVAARLRTRD